VIALLDYGSGNLRSVHKALLKVGADVQIVQRPEGMRAAQAVVLPGVGAFDDCINALRRQESARSLPRFHPPASRSSASASAIRRCLSERGIQQLRGGVGVFGGKVVRFTEQPGSEDSADRLESNRDYAPRLPALSRNVANGSYVYFVHSFYPQPTDSGIIATTTEYGEAFASSVWKDNVFATQFHPEKSQKVGLQLLKNFVEIWRA
jgi:imidazole glycerol-phosphate synthase subunit HisH